MQRSRGVLLTSVGCAAALVLSIPSVAQAERPQAPPATAPASPPGLTIATGKVAEHGQPVAGADVVAVAWPNADVLGALPDGAEFTTVPLGRTTTNGSGGFRLGADPSALPADFFDSKGRVDVQLLIGSAEQEARWHFSAALSRGADGAPRWGLPSARDRQVDVRVDLGQKVGYDANDDPAEWVTDDGTRPGPGRRARVASLAVGPRSSALNQLAPRPGTVQPMEVCVNYTGSTYTNRPERFAQVYAWQGAYGTLSEKSGNDHTLVLRI